MTFFTFKEVKEMLTNTIAARLGWENHVNSL